MALAAQLRSRWQWLLERGLQWPSCAVGLALLILVTLSLGSWSMPVRIGLLVLALALGTAGVRVIVDRAGRAIRHAERINRASVALSNEARPGILRAGLRTSAEFAGARGVEVSIVTRNVRGDLVVEANSVPRTLPYLPSIDLTPVLGPGWDEVLPGTSIERPRADLARALGMRHTQGTVLLAPMRIEGTLMGLLAVGYDGRLTRERREAIHALATLLGSALTREQHHANLVHARAEAHFQSLVQNASDLILVVRPDRSIAYQSPSVERLLGYSSHELLHRKIDSLAVQDHANALVDAVRGAIDAGSDVPVLIDSEWLDAGGERRRVSVSITNRLEIPEVGGLVLNVTDVTDQTEVNAELQRSQEALRQIHKLDAVGRLAGGIAHDFNNILGAIMMTAGSLRDELRPGRGNAQTIDEIENAAVRGARLTRQLLTFSRADAPSPEISDLNEIVGSFHKMLRRLIDERVALRVEVASTLPSVRVDRGMIEQALMNLVVNARDALPDGQGTITVTTQQRHLNTAAPAATGGKIPPGHYVVLSVGDDGTGMDPQLVPRIFEPFFTTKGVNEGTGLGLSMVYGIVRQSEGYLEVSSQRGHGTRVSIYLPARREASGPHVQALPQIAPHGRGRLLVVEDDDAVRRAAVRVLHKHGYEVHYAPNAAEAEAMFDEWEHRFDLVVTDVVMPGRSGPELISALRRRKPDLRVLYISGYSDGVLVSLGESETLLRKPFRPGELAIRVHSMLELLDDEDDAQAL